MLTVNLLGGASFSVDGKVVRSELGPAGRLLACYLFEFPGRAHRRERLADLFWGDLDQDNARSALNTAIWRVRKLLETGLSRGGRYLVSVGNDIVLEPAPSVVVDTHKLQDAARRAAKQAEGGGLTLEEELDIAAAVESYGGPFLDGEDGDWVLEERERLHCLFVRSTVELMRAAARRTDYERALELGRQVLAHDALREAIQRDVMLLLVLNGQRAEAVHAFKRLRNLLKLELGIEPMPETKRIYDEILSGRILDQMEEYAVSQFSPRPGPRR
jgi:DNA-binding SARP family transcriptional activator